jgi:hypothetical protein
MSEHIHAEVLRALADGRAVQSWESGEGGWQTETPETLKQFNPISNPNMKWRVKPDTHFINGIECSAPIRVKPEEDTSVFVAAVSIAELYFTLQWRDALTNTRWLERGLLHLTKEAAIENANAMLAFGGVK